MHFFRRTLTRRITLLILLSWGLLTQVTTVYACGSDKGKKQISCCCDTISKTDCKHNNSKCDNHNDNSNDGITHSSPNQSASSCCEISYGVIDASPASSISASLQVLLLDASQPPPLLSSYQTKILFHVATLTIPQISTPLMPNTGTQTYLHTQRLRI